MSRTLSRIIVRILRTPGLLRLPISYAAGEMDVQGCDIWQIRKIFVHSTCPVLSQGVRKKAKQNPPNLELLPAEQQPAAVLGSVAASIPKGFLISCKGKKKAGWAEPKNEDKVC